MIFTSCTRDDLLNVLPKNGVIVEVGVCKGSFSKKILDVCNPKKLFLVDLWDLNPVVDPAFVSKQDVVDSYNVVLNLFESEIKTGQVVVVKSNLNDAIQLLDDASVDAVYVDANHSYNAVKNDLNLINGKLKKHGLFLAHDYTNNFIAKKDGFDVVNAVNDFVSENKYHILALTITEAFPTVLFSKVYENPQDLVLNLVVNLSKFSLDVTNVNFKLVHDVFFSNVINKDVVHAKLIVNNNVNDNNVNDCPIAGNVIPVNNTFVNDKSIVSSLVSKIFDNF